MESPEVDEHDAEAPLSEAPSSKFDETLAAGTVVDHFRITRLVGRGGMGEVYAARDLRLGRRVALKVVAPGHFQSATMRERFLVEAQTTARFSHPNIVTIYAVGEYAGCPYLALEYLEGETLLERMRQRLPSEAEALRIALAIAEALAEAHRHGVLHRDLKPGNVHLGQDGRVRVLDFGLAKVMGRPEDPAARAQGVEETVATGVRSAIDELAAKTFGVGTPAYMAPEQWLEDPCTGATDVWATGVVLFAMLTGRLPYHPTNLHELAVEVCSSSAAPRVRELVSASAEVDDLVAACLEKSLAHRPTAASLVDRLQAMVSVTRRPRDEGASPFRGLAPFTRDDEHIFFGREQEIAAFVERVRTDCILPVVGASGSGKSSFVQAGVVPRLLEQERWTVIAIRIGRDPFASLAARLVEGEDTSNPSLKERQAFEAPTRVVKPAAVTPDPRPRAQLQTVSPGDHETMTERLSRKHFVPPAEAPARKERRVEQTTVKMSTSGSFRRDLFEVAARLHENPGHLGFELRALAEARGTRVLLFVDQLEELFTQGLDDETVKTFVESLATTIDDPLEPVRVVFTIRDDFFGRLAVTASVGSALGRVTLLRRPDASALEEVLTGPLRARDYRFEDGSLAREMVEAVHDQPNCLPLLQFTANLLWTKRDRERRLLTRAAYDELGGVAGALAGHADGVLAGMTEAQVATTRRMLLRLVTPERTRKVVARDALLEGLGEDGPVIVLQLIEARLLSTTKWLDERSATVIELAHEALIRTWGTLRRWVEESHEDVVVMAQLEQAARLWLDRGTSDEQLWRGDALAEARRFVTRTSAELPASIRDFVHASEHIEKSRRGRRRLVVVSAFLVAAAIAVSSILAGFTIAEERDRAERGRAETLREGARAALVQGQALEARAKIREALEIDDSVTARLLWRQASENPVEWSATVGGRAFGVAVAPDGARVVLGSSDGVVNVFDAVTRERRALRGHTDQILSVAASSDGRWFASSSLDRTIRIWDAERLVTTHVLKGYKDAIHTARFSPDGERLLAGSYAGEIRVWNVRDGRELLSKAAHDAPIRGIGWSHDGERIASGDAKGRVRIWKAGTLEPAGELVGEEHTVYGLAFRPDGAELATSSFDGLVRLYDLAKQSEVARLAGHSSGLYRVVYSSDGTRLASTSDDHHVVVWDVDRRAKLRDYTLPSASTDVAFFPDGARVAVATLNEEAFVLRLDREASAAVRGHDSPVNQAALASDASWLVSAGNDGRLVIRDAKTGAVRHASEASAVPLNAVAIAPNGRTILTGDGNGVVRQWTSAGAPERVLLSHKSSIYSLAIAPNGRTAVAGAHDGAILAIDLESGSTKLLAQGRDRIRGIVFDRLSLRVATVGHDSHVRIFDLAEGKLTKDHDLARGRIYGAAMHPLEPAVAVACADGAIVRVDLENGETKEIAAAGVRCYGMEYEAKGRWLAAPCADGAIRIIDKAGVTKLVDAHAGEVNTVALSTDGTLAVTASDDTTVQLFDTDGWRPRWFTRGTVPLAEARAAEVPSLDATVAIRSQRGWTTASGEPLAAPGTRWGQALEDAQASAVSRDGKILCVLRTDGTLEEHELATDRVRGKAEVGGGRVVIATVEGCYALGERGVTRLASGATKTLERRDLTAIGEADTGLLVADAREVTLLDGALERSQSAPVEGRVSALAARGSTLVVGYHDGHIERRSFGGPAVVEFDGTTASPVLRIVPGPADTWIAGTGGGDVALWAADDVRRLERGRLHGPVTELVVVRGSLFATTQRGDGLAWDLRALERPRCELLREVRQAVPVLWRDGHAVRASNERGACQ
ncbi:MAG: protein kinase [Deltaproteobacteria bacterium]|nr:protein kinase [Deltaproteobacteria bacterium]